MKPSRGQQQHPPIAFMHAVARWIGAYQGWMRNELPHGDIVVVAPRYDSVATRRSFTQRSAQELVSKYQAKPLGGTRQALLALLEKPPKDPVALLYFAGHGVFNADAPGSSAIKLENGERLTADEVQRKSVLLGERHGTVVYLSACEVGAASDTLGEAGGWATAFLARRFGAFIAPLWAIEEEDAQAMTQSIVEKMIVERQPIGAALRDIRRDRVDSSSTVYSYVIYGDVTAHFAKPRRSRNARVQGATSSPVR
jgi:CHAT domain-containing protein